MLMYLWMIKTSKLIPSTGVLDQEKCFFEKMYIFCYAEENTTNYFHRVYNNILTKIVY